jgi:uncharacterized membrane protein
MSVLKNILKGSASAWALSTFVKKSGDTMTGNLIFKTVEATLAGTYTMTENLGQLFNLDPNGADRDVLLPPNPTVGLQIFIRNSASTGTSNLVVKNSAGTVITRGTIANQVALVFTYFAAGWSV